MFDESVLYVYGDYTDMLGVVTELQLADIDDEGRERHLRQWVERTGEDYEEWMTVVVNGPPVSGDVPGEVEVTVG